MAKKYCKQCKRNVDEKDFVSAFGVCKVCHNKGLAKDAATIMALFTMCGVIIKWCWNATRWCFKMGKIAVLWGVAKYKEHQAAKAVATPIAEAPKAE